MKTILVITNLLFLSAAIYFGYQYYKPKQFPFPPDNTCVPCKDYTGTKVEGIPAQLALLEIKNYKKSLGTPVGRDTNFIDSRTVWFSLDSIKRFIWHIENELCENKVVDKKNLGIRMYFGRYPSFDLWGKYDTDVAHQEKMKEYQNLHTMFMMPTYFDSKHNVDFDPRPEFVKTDAKGNQSEMSIQEILEKMVQGQTAHNTQPKPARWIGQTGQQSITISNTANNWNIFSLAPALDNKITNADTEIPPKYLSSDFNIYGGAGFLNQGDH